MNPQRGLPIAAQQRESGGEDVHVRDIVSCDSEVDVALRHKRRGFLCLEEESDSEYIM